MEKFSRPATLDDLKTLLRSLNANKVEYLLVGGYALAAHGYQRATTDVDIVVPAVRASGERLRLALMVLPDGAAREIEPEWFEAGENIRVADAFVVDVLFNANGQTYESLRPYAQTVYLEDIPVQTVNLEGLLLTKQTMRERDVGDRLILERALEILRQGGQDRKAD